MNAIPSTSRYASGKSRCRSEMSMSSQHAEQCRVGETTLRCLRPSSIAKDDLLPETVAYPLPAELLDSAVTLLERNRPRPSPEESRELIRHVVVIAFSHEVREAVEPPTIVELVICNRPSTAEQPLGHRQLETLVSAESADELTLPI